MAQVFKKQPGINLLKFTFSNDLHAGHGRAFLYVKQHGLSQVYDEVLHACLEHTAYDKQCEGYRSDWLHQLIKLAPEYEHLCDVLLDEYQRQESEHDLSQLSGIVLQMALNANQTAAQILRQQVLQQDFKADWTDFGCEELVRLDGLPAIMQLLKRYARLLASTGELEFLPEDLFTDDENLREQAYLQFAKLAHTDAELAQLLKRLRPATDADTNTAVNKAETSAASAANQASTTSTLTRILDDAKQGIGDYPGQYARFGKRASQAELMQVLAQLEQSECEQETLRLLWVFRRKDPPELNEKIWQLARSGNRQLQVAALVTLSHQKNPAVRQLALELLQQTISAETLDGVLDSLMQNIQDEDQTLVLAQLQRLDAEIAADIDIRHHLASSISKIAESNPEIKLGDILNWAYQHTPCTICRRYLVVELLARQIYTKAMAEQDLYDADEDTRQLAAEFLGVAAVF